MAAWGACLRQPATEHATQTGICQPDHRRGGRPRLRGAVRTPAKGAGPGPVPVLSNPAAHATVTAATMAVAQRIGRGVVMVVLRARFRVTVLPC